ncbi:MAG: hemerythrin domain-containing protein [Acidimicrobiia bacterium]|nr:hemerythrin domain-containing protein [Acidimicrobiia bacterium]
MMTGNEQTPTAVLREEHQLILKVAGRLDEMLTDEERGEELQFDTLESCITFFRLFTDAFHHGKEEDLLFPGLEEEGLPSDSGPIAAFLEDHAQGRVYVADMVASLEEARAGDAQAGRAVRDAARAYVDLIVDHISREDGILFDMADNMITGSACSTLCSRYDDVCASKFEGKTKADLERLAEAII